EGQSTEYTELMGYVLLLAILLVWAGIGETYNFSILYVFPNEALCAVLVGATAGYLVQQSAQTAFPNAGARSPVFFRITDRLSTALTFSLVIAGLILTMSLHSIDSPLLGLISLYIILILTDYVVAALLGAFKREKGDYLFLSPRRWLFTVPAV